MIKYKIKMVRPNVFAVVVEDDYQLAMTFCRVQEFYESSNEEFRGKNFSIWKFMDWYSREHNGSFTYASDWAGFNIPFEVLEQCMNEMKEIESPYDKVMQSIYNLVKNQKTEGKAYIIGVPDLDGPTFIHEVCHALYYTNDEYKEAADKITQELKRSIPTAYNFFCRNLKTMGYAEEVFDDEIQAYLTTNWENKNFGQSVDSKIKRKLHSNYIAKLEKFLA